METQVAEKMLGGTNRTKAVPAKKKHPIDCHFTIPVFFNRFYCVFSLGKDRRTDEEICPDFDQRVKTQAVDMAFAVLILLCFCSFFGMLILRAVEGII